MNSTALALTRPDELETIQRTGKLLAASGYFGAQGDSVQAIAQMATKIMAGREIGIGPFAAVNGIHIIQGKPAIGANLMAASVKGSGRYDYRVRQLDNEGCKIEFFQRAGDKWESIGVSEFTRKDALAAKTQNMDKFPRNMMFARAMSNGVRWYCPDIFNGNSVYVPEEIGAIVNGEGEVIEVPAVAIADPRQDVDFGKEDADKADAPTDEENDILSMWQVPMDAYVWAVNVGACDNEFEAKNSMKKIVDAHGGKLNTSNKAAVLLAFLRRQMDKLAAMEVDQAQPEVAPF